MNFSNSYHLFTEAINWTFNRSCGGELQVSYRNKLEPVCPLKSKFDADKICQELKCGNASDQWNVSIEKGADINIECKDEHKYTRHCFKPQPGACKQTASFNCDGKCKV